MVDTPQQLLLGRESSLDQFLVQYPDQAVACLVHVSEFGGGLLAGLVSSIFESLTRPSVAGPANLGLVFVQGVSGGGTLPKTDAVLDGGDSRPVRGFGGGGIVPLGGVAVIVDDCDSRDIVEADDLLPQIGELLVLFVEIVGHLTGHYLLLVLYLVILHLQSVELLQKIVHELGSKFLQRNQRIFEENVDLVNRPIQLNRSQSSLTPLPSL